MACHHADTPARRHRYALGPYAVGGYRLIEGGKWGRVGRVGPNEPRGPLLSGEDSAGVRWRI